MIKVIDGKRYNTETATRVFCYENGHFVSDFRYRSKELYLTKKGNWFVFHEGGAMTDMAASAGNNGTSGSSDIEPVTPEDAFGFLQAHSGEYDSAEKALEEHFASWIEEA